MYAVIRTGGKQYKVAEGDILRVEKLNAEVDSTVELNEVLMIGGDGAVMTIGTPTVSGASVSAEVISQGKGPKVISFKYKPKKATRVKKGHRQLFTEIKIKAIKA